MESAMQRVKTMVKAIIPRSLHLLIGGWRLSRLRKLNKATPIKEVFTTIYERHLWGGTDRDYCSGSGSTPIHASRFADAVLPVIAEKRIQSVVDLGCGDFEVGKTLRLNGVRYIGIDIVDALIKRNHDTYSDARTSFACLDIVKDPLPHGDLCLIRQVLQHLSNAEIASVLHKTKQFRYVVITEHYPARLTGQPNLDKPHGPDTRVYDGSAVFLDLPPFNVSPGSMTLLLDTDAEVYLVERGERLKTFLIENS